MPSYFPCPNAQCSYQFDADILPAAAMVTCPLCKTRFPYRAARPVSAAAGPEGAAAPTDEPRAAPAGPRMVNLRDKPKSTVVPTILWVGGFSVVLGLLIVGVVMKGKGPSHSGTDAHDEKFNIKVEMFPEPWEPDITAQKPVDANIMGRKRTGPDAWVAVAAKDFIDRQPRTSEVDALMQKCLSADNGFKSVEQEPVDEQTWAGQPAKAVRFAATLEENQIRGEAFAMSYKGVAYVYIAWAPDGSWEAVRSEAIGLREKVRPAGFREKWVAKRANTQEFPGEGYQVEDPDGVWIRAKPEDQWKKEDKIKYPLEDPKDLDENATMAFLCQYQFREKGDNKRLPAEAKALVVVLDGGGDPMEAAKAHVIERIKKDFAGVAPEIKLEVMNRSPGGVALPTAGPAIGRFLFRDPQDLKNPTVYVISAVSAGGKTVAVEAHTLEKNASYVDEWMVHLAGSLKAK